MLVNWVNKWERIKSDKSETIMSVCFRKKHVETYLEVLSKEAHFLKCGFVIHKHFQVILPVVGKKMFLIVRKRCWQSNIRDVMV